MSDDYHSYSPLLFPAVTTTVKDLRPYGGGQTIFAVRGKVKNAAHLALQNQWIFYHRQMQTLYIVGNVHT